MPQDLLHKIIFTLISGFTEFLPVSARPHQMLYQLMTGFEQSDAWLTLAIRLGALAAVLVCCKGRIKRLRRESRLSRLSKRRRSRQPDMAALLDMRLLKTAAIPILIGVLFYKRAGEWISGVALLSLMLLINGVILFLPRLLKQGNKDGRSVSGLDGILLGLGGALGMIPGFSRMGGILTAGQSRGLDRGYALDTALLLSIPALLGLLVFDVYTVAAAKAGLTFLAFIVYLLCAAISFGGGYLGIMLMRFLSVKAGFTGFAYYSWGLALFSFILYLMI